MGTELERLIDTTRDGTIVDTIKDAETDARRRARNLENRGLLPHGYTHQHHPLTPTERRECEHLAASLLLAADWQTYVDLARGNTVPRHRLDARYLHLLERWAA